MDTCKSCLVKEPYYEFLSEDPATLDTFQHIRRHIQLRDKQEESTLDRLFIVESAVPDFYDFAQDHLAVDKLTFRVEEQDWKSFHEVPNSLRDRWVDEVIREENITPWAQPILDREGQLYGHEMLARFKMPDGSLASPAEVFAAAKRRNRLYALDRACRMAAVRHSVHLPAKVFINFIPTSIYSPQHCLQSTIALSRQLGLEPDKFVFEVVESENVEDREHLKSILEFYKAQQFRYALDDVGEGYSTLELLQEIEPHYMKLDRAYVHESADNPAKQEMALRMLHAAQELGAVPLAEGVEREADFAWLREQGYQLFQGYLFGKPQPIAS